MPLKIKKPNQTKMANLFIFWYWTLYFGAFSLVSYLYKWITRNKEVNFDNKFVAPFIYLFIYFPNSILFKKYFLSL